MIPFDQINQAALSSYPALLREWFPAGKIVGNEFVLGDLSGAPGRSLSINVRTGAWGDFSGDQRGGDPISLAAAAFHNGDQVAAAKALGSKFGVYLNGSAAKTQPVVQPSGSPNEWRDSEPPEDAPEPDLSGWDHAYIYRDALGYPLRYVLRRDAHEGHKKVIIPLTWGTLDGVDGWHRRHPLEPRCLYGLDRLSAMPDEAVIVCEGEKAADAAQALFPRNPCITWTAGSGNVGRADWQPLRGRRVIIWPDNDETGQKAAAAIVAAISAIAASVQVLRVDDLPEKADAADTHTENPLAWLKERLPDLAQPDQCGAIATVTDDSDSPRRRCADLDSIQVKAGEIDLTSTAGEQALLLSNLPLYQRGGVLVRPARREVSASGGRVTVAAGLTEITAPAMIDLLNQAVGWEKWDCRGEKWVTCNPPPLVASVIMSRAGQWPFPSIGGVITTPTLRPDGSVLAIPGYDAATRLFYVRDPSLTIDAECAPLDRAAAERSIAELEGLLSGFPFVGDVDRAVALSALITPVCRGVMPVSPLHAFRATTAGSGKSFLADIASAISAGRPCPVVSAGFTEEETEKRLVGLLLGGYPLLSLDNVNGELGGDLLCQAAERPLIRVRELGKSSIIEIENRATLFANGNNLRVRGDMTRRTLLADLDAGMERPELRQFQFDPFEEVLNDRGRYVLAALTVVRAFLASGAAIELAPLASFEGWSRTVRAALVWLGRADPCASMERARDDDPELSDLREMLSLWRDAVGADRQITVRELDALSSEHKHTAVGVDPNELQHPEFRDALLRMAGHRDELNGRRLGKWLAAHEGRIVDGLCLRRASAEGSRVAQWKVGRK